MAVAQTLEELFEVVVPQNKDKFIQKVGDLQAKVFFDITGEDGWILNLQNSNLTIERSSNTTGEDCRITGSRMIFEEILQGKRKILSSMMFGKVKFKGDLILAKKIAAIFQE